MSELHGKTITAEMRDQWLEARKHRLGASEISAAIGLNQYDSQLRLWLTKTGKLPPKEVTPEMEVGSILEPAILELYQRRMNKKIVMTQIFYVARNYDFLCATLDGITSDGINVQVKNVGCASAQFWGPEGTDEVPHNVLMQVQQEMLCADMSMTHVAALIGGNDLRVYTIYRDEKIIQRMIQLGRQFIERVTTNNYPEPNQEKDHELIKYLFPGCEGSVVFTEEQTKTTLKWEQVGDNLKLLEKEHKDLKKAIGIAMGEASQATLTNGQVLYRSITRVPASTREVKGYTFPVFRLKDAK